MIVLVALASIAFFLIAFWLLKITRVSGEALKTSRSAIAALGDKSLDDNAREKIIQSASIKLFGAFISIFIRTVLTLAISVLPIWLAHWTEIARMDVVIDFLSRWDVIAIISVVIIGGYFILKQAKPYQNEAFNVNYSKLDRLLHRVAFFSPSVQLTAADMEKMVFGQTFTDIKVEAPIFITSLPRAGTTLMLEALHRFPNLATHTYRDMPFVMAPVIWSKLSGNFRKETKLVERAHGDGMEVGYDSPEAFEEVLWHTFWPQKYTQNNIALWDSEDKDENAQCFFKAHMQKIIALRQPDAKNGGRYLSKNNGNIARLDFIGEMFPDAFILVPLRHPIEHAASLWRQHLNFLKMQENDTFIKRYMADIGHFDFGELHRPILFPLTEQLTSIQDPLTLDYWISYWIAAFSYVLEREEKVILISYEGTCKSGKVALTNLCQRLNIDTGGMMESVAAIFKEPSQKHYDTSGIDPKLLKRAEKLYSKLEASISQVS
jgi:hypothetical protein